MKKLLVIFAAVAAVLAVTAATALAGSQTFTGQGLTNGVPSNQICTPGDDGGVGGDVSGNYMLWNLPGVPESSGPVTLHLADGDVQMSFNGTWKYVSTLYPANQIVNVVTATWAGDPASANNLTISHGCSNAAVDSHISTTIHDASHNAITSAELGATVHDTATVTVDNNVAIPTGSKVTFNWYTATDCGGDVADTSTVDAAASVENGLPKGPLGAGDYGYKASFKSGDTSKVKDSTGVCEPLHINKKQLSISTDIHNASHAIITQAFVNQVVHDTATVTGGVAGFALPSVTFTFDGNAVANNATPDPVATVTARSVDSGPLTLGSHKYNATVAGNDNYIGATSADEPLEVVNAAWCSPGYWRNADQAAWDLIGVQKTAKFNSTVYPVFYGATFIINPSLFDVLSASGNTYKGAGVAGTGGYPAMNAFNATGAYLTSKIPGFTFSGNTSVDNCPIDNHGVFKP